MSTPHRQVGSRYVADARIGHGGMGEVWRGRDLTSGGAVAVKFLRSDLVAREDFVARFLRESRILKALDDPRLVGIIDFVAEGSSLAIVMDLVIGRDLGSVLTEQGPVDEQTAVQILDETLQGLAVVHRNGIVHGDLKPPNLLMPADGRPLVRIADFGIARIVEDAATGEPTSQIVGSPAYMAPELAEGRRPDRASDIYAIGVLAHELLAGRPPFHGGNPMSILFRHVHEEPTRPAGVSDALWHWVSQLLAKDPVHRPADAMMALAMLRSATADSAATVTVGESAVPPSVSWAPDAPPAASGVRQGTQVLPADGTRVLPPAHGTVPAPPAAPPPEKTEKKGRRRPLAPLAIALLALVVVVQGVLLFGLLRNSGEQGRPLTGTPGPSPSASAGTPTRAPSPGVRRATGPLPDVVGMHITSAQDTLASYGYGVQIRQQVDDNRPDGEVTGQEPGAGGHPSDGSVLLTVSRRSTVVWLAELDPVEGTVTPTRVELSDRSFAQGVAIGEACATPRGVTYDLGRRYTRLNTVVAVAGEPESEIPVRYQIALDGRELHSGQLNAGDRQQLQIDVDGGALLRIEAARADDGAGCASTRFILGDPRLVGLPS